jgi:hypothetical protein
MNLPSPSWNLNFKLITKSVTKTDLELIDNYTFGILNVCYHHLQNTREINRNYSLSVFLLHYLFNKLIHFRISFQYFFTHFLKIRYQLRPIHVDIKQCICIFCIGPKNKQIKIESNLDEYFQHLIKQPQHVQKIMLSLLEKIFDLNCLHTMILNYQYPHLDTETISNFVFKPYEIKT